MADQSAVAGPSRTQASRNADERRPLLASGDGGHDLEGQDPLEADESATSSSDVFDQVVSMRRASWILCYVSSILLGLQIIILCLYTFRPDDFSELYRLPSVWPTIFVTTFLALFQSVVNLTRLERENKAGIVFNMICHLVIGFFAIMVSGEAANNVQYDWPHCETTTAGPCHAFLKPFLLFLCLNVIFAVLLGWIVHPAMLIFWFVKARQALGNPGRRSFSIPAGQLTFEFTVKFLRQEEGMVRRSGNDRGNPSA